VENVFYYSLFARRFHDVGKSGWYAAWMFFRVVNITVFIYFLFARSKTEGNKYGPNIRDQDIFFHVVFGA